MTTNLGRGNFNGKERRERKDQQGTEITYDNKNFDANYTN